MDEDRVRRIWKRAVIPYVEEQCAGDLEKVRGFEFDRLRGQLNGMANSSGATYEGAESPEVSDDAHAE